MSQIIIHKGIRPTNAVTAMVDQYFAGMGQGVNAYLLTRSRYNQIARLNAKSDTELAALNLTRENIVPHVFGDLFGA
ncbi:hypothetical protein E4Z66_12750 [Aliishimia ponticola]|uniref:Uncharacterized protein n=1 Tax=Aliishimia ponticola TaxID=2499833 RepID=A0A4S4NIK8_9RHOB|nr:hypothetical protein [Aliishimia ponticola]THH35930.1 hypothetical protein E4Z66_12750 [Aliishimia ponticola]